MPCGNFSGHSPALVSNTVYFDQQVKDGAVSTCR